MSTIWQTHQKRRARFDWLRLLSLISAILVSAAFWRCVYLYIWKGLMHQ